MARHGGGDVGKVLLVIGGVALLAYLIGGRGKANSFLLPDLIEDRIDRVVAALNSAFGNYWVNKAMDYLQSQIEFAMPGAAAIVKAVYWAEQNFGGHSGAVKKQQAMSVLKA